MAKTSLEVTDYVGKIQHVLVVLVAVIAGVLCPTGARYVQPITVLIATHLVYSSLRGFR